MSHKLKFALISLPFLAIILIISFTNGYHFYFLNDPFGKEYNRSRILEDQPIIEDYFVEDEQVDILSHSWSLSDRAKTFPHIGKFYTLNILGNLKFEVDYYNIKLDSAWVAKRIDEIDSTPPVVGLKYSYLILRKYYPKNHLISFQIEFQFEDGSIIEDTLPFASGDSIFKKIPR